MKIGHAPRYQGRLTLAERLQIRNSTGWRAVNAKELSATCADDGGDLSIIGIPGHLLKRWWSLAEAEDFTSGFECYAREMVEYLTYKNWIKPGEFLMTVAASGGNHDRALVPSNPMRFGGGAVGALVACINLDDEKAAIAFKAESGRVRVILEPGEGLLFPERSVLWNRSKLGNSELAVTLLIGSLLD
ncbi:hypothetical protein [Candidatus Binatus sp.]|uniref:hypothetical protein n=1 Tax=Candidatus Binatus sp. TaxID=2811406 RepID=UPI003C9BB554